MRFLKEMLNELPIHKLRMHSRSTDQNSTSSVTKLTSIYRTRMLEKTTKFDSNLVL